MGPKRTTWQATAADGRTIEVVADSRQEAIMEAVARLGVARSQVTAKRVVRKVG